MRTPASSKTKSLSEYIGDGSPARKGADLPPESYVSFETKKLRNARVLWVNFEALRELGIHIPEAGLTPEFEESILDHFAYMVPQEKDAPDDFVDQSKTFYADRYGGHGIGLNGGSARAGTTGPLQVKNIGQTPLVDTGTSFDHAHGGGSIKEAVQEAVWGEVNNRELPWKANRVLFILDTNTYTHWQDGSKEKRSLIIREDPLRPAHFIDAPFYKVKPGQIADKERVRKSFSTLLSALPRDSKTANQNADISGSIYEMYGRFVDQLAAARAKKIFHGALSPSNIEASGKYLDYASLTFTPGYTNVLPDVEVFEGAAREIERIKSNYKELKSSIDKYSAGTGIDRQKTPSISDLNNFINKRYEQKLNNALIEQLGFPEHLVKQLQSSKEVQSLSRSITELIKYDSNQNVKNSQNFAEVKRHAKFDKLIEIIFTDPHRSFDDKVALITKELEITKELASSLTDRIHNYFKLASETVQPSGIDPDNLRKTVLILNGQRTPDVTELYRESFKSRIVSLVDSYANNKNRSEVWEFIDDTVSSSKRGLPTNAKLEITISQLTNLLHGVRERVVLDPRTLKKTILIEAPIVNEQIHWYQHRIDAKNAHELKLLYTKDLWKQQATTKAQLEDSKVVFEIPADDLSIKEVEFILGREDTHYWWKDGDQNFKLHPFAHSTSPNCSMSLNILNR